MDKIVRYAINSFVALLIGTAVIASGTTAAMAACSSPSGNEGAINYTSANEIHEYCDGTNWISFSSSGSIKWSNNSSDIYYSSGNVGVGTNSPTGNASSILHIDGTTGQLHLSSTVSGATSTDGSLISHWSDNALYITNQESGDIIFYTSGSEAMRINSAGELGVGKTPSVELDVLLPDDETTAIRVDDNETAGQIVLGNGTSTADVFIPNIGGYPRGTSSAATFYRSLIDASEDTGSNPVLILDGRQTGAALSNRDILRIRSYVTDYFTVQADGDVGIGTTSPSDTLEVAGGIKFTSGVLTFPDDSTMSTAALNGLSDVITDYATSNSMYLGSGAGGLATSTALDNVALGDLALDALTEGDRNVAIGSDALSALTTGSGNIAIGEDALSTSSSGSYNIGIGEDALKLSTSTYNIAVGYAALDALTGGTQNTAVGSFALSAVTTTNSNTAVGSQAGEAITGDGNVALGLKAMENGTGNNNVAIGKAAFSDAGSTASGVVAIGNNALGLNETGDNNVAVGSTAMYDVQDGTNNVAVGQQAARGATNVDVSNNVIIGAEAGLVIDTGSNNNVMLGTTAGRAVTTGANNILLGYDAARSLTTGSNNIAIGYDVELSSNTGSNQMTIGNLIFGTGIDGTGTSISSGNIGIGTATPAAKLDVSGTINAEQLCDESGANCTDLSGGVGATDIDGLSDAAVTGGGNIFLGHDGGSYGSGDQQNIAIGITALDALNDSTGQSNIGIGYNALTANTGGDNNIGVGADTLEANTTGARNIAIGSNTIKANQTGDDNIAIGHNVLNLATGNYNTAVGSFSMDAVTTAANNVALGYGTLSTNETGNGNVAVGYNALTLATGASNTAVGSGSMDAITSGASNVALGNNSLGGNQTGSGNVAVGSSAMLSQTGSFNTAVGQNVLLSGSGSYNTAVGLTAGGGANNGSYNVAIGPYAGAGGVTGNSNIAIGSTALQFRSSGANNIGIGGGAAKGASGSSFSNNVFVGSSAGEKLTSGSNNTGVGFFTGYNITTGANNVLMGLNTANSLTTGSNNIAIGYDVELPSNTGSNQMTIGNLIFGTGINGTGTNISSGNIGIGIASPTEKLHIDRSDAANTYIRLSNTNAGGYGAGLRMVTPDRTWTLAASDDASGIDTSGAFGLRDETAAAWRMVVDSGGNVGIGATSPALSVNGSSKAVHVYQNDANGSGFRAESDSSNIELAAGSSKNFLYSLSNTPLGIYTNGAERLSIVADGNVGIGVTDPDQLLEVAGGIKFTSGVLTFPDSSTMSAAPVNDTNVLRNLGRGSSFNFNTLDAGVGGVRWVDGGGTNSNGPENSGNTNGTLIQFEPLYDQPGNEDKYKMQISSPTTGPLYWRYQSNGTWQGWNKFVTENSSGNVGIGTSSPGSKLDVNGTLRVTEICDESGANCNDVSAGLGGGDGAAVSGTVNSDGTIIQGSGFTINKTSTGTYEIDFDTSFSAAPIAVVSPYTMSGMTSITALIKENVSTASQITVTTFKTGGSAYQDSDFSFVAVDPNGLGTGGEVSAWTTSGSDAYRTSGNVGIGTSSPGRPLTVVEDDGVASGNHWMGEFTKGGGSDPQLLLGYAANGSEATDALIMSGNGKHLRLRTSNSENLLMLHDDGKVGIGTTSPDLTIDAEASGTSHGLRLYNTGSTVDTRVYAYSAEAYIGTWSNHPVLLLANNGVLKLETSGNVCGDDSAFEACSSDARLKKDVQDLDDGMLGRVKKLRPVTFTWNDVGVNEYGYKEGQYQNGFIAQEIIDVFPEWVSKDEKGYYKVDDGKLRYVLLAATQELSAEFDALKEENATLKAAKTDQEDRLAQLEKDIHSLKAHTSYGVDKAQFGFGMLLGMLITIGTILGLMFAIRQQKS